jgi:hypothetical protein
MEVVIDELPICPYGPKCYRKNPAHFKEYSHNFKKPANPIPQQTQEEKSQKEKESNKENKGLFELNVKIPNLSGPIPSVEMRSGAKISEEEDFPKKRENSENAEKEAKKAKFTLRIEDDDDDDIKDGTLHFSLIFKGKQEVPMQVPPSQKPSGAPKLIVETEPKSAPKLKKPVPQPELNPKKKNIVDIDNLLRTIIRIDPSYSTTTSKGKMTLVFPSFSTSHFSYDPETAAKVAMECISEFLKSHSEKDIELVLVESKETLAFKAFQKVHFFPLKNSHTFTAFHCRSTLPMCHRKCIKSCVSCTIYCE